MPFDFDVIVIGGGAGGGTFAYKCALAGKRVLLVERGGRPAPGENHHDEQATLIGKRPYDDRTVRVNGEPRLLYVGGGLGGGTALYGAALMRPSAGDFHPGHHYGSRLPRAVWDWPITYEALEPYYTEAERLYGVAGDGGDDFGPLAKPRDGFPNEAAPLHPINRRLVAANRAHGLKPFRLPLVIDFRSCWTGPPRAAPAWRCCPTPRPRRSPGTAAARWTARRCATAPRAGARCAAPGAMPWPRARSARRCCCCGRDSAGHWSAATTGAPAGGVPLRRCPVHARRAARAAANRGGEGPVPLPL